MTTPFTFGSVCSGIEAASVAWGPLGWRASWFAEIEPFPSAVLAHHYPQTPNLGDMTQIAALVRHGLVEAPAALVGGTPCQAFSVAGARGGLSDPRGQLTLAYADLANAIDEKRREREARANASFIGKTCRACCRAKITHSVVSSVCWPARIAN